MDDDLPEVIELEEAAAWRLRQLDADPADRDSARAAAALQQLADELRARPGMALLGELHALCNWLAESEAIGDYAELAQSYRARIGVDQHPADATAYLRALIEVAKQVM